VVLTQKRRIVCSIIVCTLTGLTKRGYRYSMKDIERKSLAYHADGGAGKTSILVTKPCENQKDLSLAYTPGVAVPCIRIKEDRSALYEYTNAGNLVAVVSNGTAVLGLGDIGPMAGKPVMEGKCVLFKRFADVDAFDINVDAVDPDFLVDVIKAISPGFGAINLEDVKAPDCFYVERKLKEELSIPIFHDDQHGTAVILAAGFINVLKIANKRASDVKVVFSGAGAAAVACAKMLEKVGVRRNAIWMFDRKGLVGLDRAEDEPSRGRYAKSSNITLKDALIDADVFIGLSVGGVVNGEMISGMAKNPAIFALANPMPEILPEEVKSVRSDAIVATGRSDYPNQLNNVLGFPFIFRGALDVGASEINEEMKLAAAKALADLAEQPVPKHVEDMYDGVHLEFGVEYIIPKPLDSRVLLWESPAVAKAAMDSGVAERPIINFDAYISSLMKRLHV